MMSTKVAYAEKCKEKFEHQGTLFDLKNAGDADLQLHLLIFESTGGMFKLMANAISFERAGYRLLKSG